MKIVVIGGVAAGGGAAAKARRTNEDCEIIIIERGGYVSFANCGLPYYVGGVIEDEEELMVFDDELFRSRFNVDVRLHSDVTKIDRANKCITVRKDDGTEYTETYDKLVIGTGGKPVVLPIPGADKKNIFNVFTIPDAEAIVSKLEAGTKSAVVIGGGFIGLESAENLREKGIEVTLVERLPQVMSNMDPEFSEVIIRELESLGIRVLVGAAMQEIVGGESVEGVKLDSGETVPCDMLIMAAGVKGSTELAKEAGLAIGETGGVLVDATMRTSDADIYAAGDIVESTHLVTGKKVRIPLAGSANKQGRVAGANAAGGNLLFKGVLGTAIIKVGTLTAARTGLNTREAEQHGYDFETVYVPGFSNATYYPDAMPMIMKYTVQHQTGKLLGAQAIGRKGVDKRIDVLATAIYAGLTVFDLENLDLAYAPPYSSAKDPVIMGGMIASNIIRGEMSYGEIRNVQQYLDDPDAVVIDVRTQEEWDAGHIEGAILMPFDELRGRLGELDRSKNYYIYCAVGQRGYNCSVMLRNHGFKVKNLGGGMRVYNMNI